VIGFILVMIVDRASLETEKSFEVRVSHYISEMDFLWEQLKH
jgi:hypothetical protein